MSMVSNSQNDKGEKAKKFKSLNINNIYQGSSNKPQARTTIQKHGLQSLGKVPTARRTPANLPSLKSENSGNDPTINLVPTGSAGWGGESGTTSNGSSGLANTNDGKHQDKKSLVDQPNKLWTGSGSNNNGVTNAQVSSSSQQQQPTQRPLPSMNKPPPHYPYHVAHGRQVYQEHSKKAFLSQESPLFDQQFPSLGDAHTKDDKFKDPKEGASSSGAGAPVPGQLSYADLGKPKEAIAAEAAKYGPGPVLRPQTSGNWVRGMAGPQQDKPQQQQPPQSGGTGAGLPKQTMGGYGNGGGGYNNGPPPPSAQHSQSSSLGHHGQSGSYPGGNSAFPPKQPSPPKIPNRFQFDVSPAAAAATGITPQQLKRNNGSGGGSIPAAASARSSSASAPRGGHSGGGGASYRGQSAGPEGKGPRFMNSIIDNEKLRRMDYIESADDDWTKSDDNFDYNTKLSDDEEDEDFGGDSDDVSWSGTQNNRGQQQPAQPHRKPSGDRHPRHPSNSSNHHYQDYQQQSPYNREPHYSGGGGGYNRDHNRSGGSYQDRYPPRMQQQQGYGNWDRREGGGAGGRGGDDRYYNNDRRPQQYQSQTSQDQREPPQQQEEEFIHPDEEEQRRQRARKNEEVLRNIERARRRREEEEMKYQRGGGRGDYSQPQFYENEDGYGGEFYAGKQHHNQQQERRQRRHSSDHENNKAYNGGNSQQAAPPQAPQTGLSPPNGDRRRDSGSRTESGGSGTQNNKQQKYPGSDYDGIDPKHEAQQVKQQQQPQQMRFKKQGGTLHNLKSSPPREISNEKDSKAPKQQSQDAPEPKRDYGALFKAPKQESQQQTAQQLERDHDRGESMPRSSFSEQREDETDSISSTSNKDFGSYRRQDSSSTHRSSGRNQRDQKSQQRDDRYNNKDGGRGEQKRGDRRQQQHQEDYNNEGSKDQNRRENNKERKRDNKSDKSDGQQTRKQQQQSSNKDQQQQGGQQHQNREGGKGSRDQQKGQNKEKRGERREDGENQAQADGRNNKRNNEKKNDNRKGKRHDDEDQHTDEGGHQPARQQQKQDRDNARGGNKASNKDKDDHPFGEDGAESQSQNWGSFQPRGQPSRRGRGGGGRGGATGGRDQRQNDDYDDERNNFEDEGGRPQRGGRGGGRGANQSERGGRDRGGRGGGRGGGGDRNERGGHKDFDDRKKGGNYGRDFTNYDANDEGGKSSSSKGGNRDKRSDKHEHGEKGKKGADKGGNNNSKKENNDKQPSQQQQQLASDAAAQAATAGGTGAYERRQNKLPPRLAKQRDQNRLSSGSNNGGNQQQQQQQTPPQAQPPQQPPVTIPSKSGGTGWSVGNDGPSPSAEFTGTSQWGTAPGLSKKDNDGFEMAMNPQENVKKTGETVQTIIFENTNMKGGHRGKDQSQQQPMSQQPGGMPGGHPKTAADFNKAAAAGLQIPLHFGNKPDENNSSDNLKLDFTTFDSSDIASVDEHAAAKMMKEAVDAASRSAMSGLPSTDDLNMKIASVKKVWETLPAMSPSMNDSSAVAAAVAAASQGFSTTAGGSFRKPPVSVAPNASGAPTASTGEHGEDIVSGGDGPNVAKVRPQQQHHGHGGHNHPPPHIGPQAISSSSIPPPQQGQPPHHQSMAGQFHQQYSSDNNANASTSSNANAIGDFGVGSTAGGTGDRLAAYNRLMATGMANLQPSMLAASQSSAAMYQAFGLDQRGLSNPMFSYGHMLGPSANDLFTANQFRIPGGPAAAAAQFGNAASSQQQGGQVTSSSLNPGGKQQSQIGPIGTKGNSAANQFQQGGLGGLPPPSQSPLLIHQTSPYDNYLQRMAGMPNPATNPLYHALASNQATTRQQQQTYGLQGFHTGTQFGASTGQMRAGQHMGMPFMNQPPLGMTGSQAANDIVASVTASTANSFATANAAAAAAALASTSNSVAGGNNIASSSSVIPSVGPKTSVSSSGNDGKPTGATYSPTPIQRPMIGSNATLSGSIKAGVVDKPDKSVASSGASAPAADSVREE